MKKKVSKWIWILVIVAVILFIIGIGPFIFLENFHFGSTMSESSAEQIRRTTEIMSMNFEIQSAYWSNGKVIVVIKNTGPVDTNIKDVFIGDTLSKIDNTILSFKPNESITLNILNATNACNSKLKIIIQSGLEKQSNITC